MISIEHLIGAPPSCLPQRNRAACGDGPGHIIKRANGRPSQSTISGPAWSWANVTRGRRDDRDRKNPSRLGTFQRRRATNFRGTILGTIAAQLRWVGDRQFTRHSTMTPLTNK